MTVSWLDVSDTTPRISYVATSGQVTFAVPFAFHSAAHLAVYKNSVLLTYVTHYVVTGVDEEAGGSIILVTGATVSDAIVIARVVPFELVTHIPPSGPLDVPAINVQFALFVMMLQQLIADGFESTIPSNGVTNTKLADMAQSTIKGRAAAAGTGDPTDLTAAQVGTLLSLAGDFVVDATNNLTGLASEWVSKTVTATPADAGGGTLSVNLARVAADNVDAGTGFIIGHQRRYIFGGSTVKGGRIAGYDFVANTATTNSASANRNYVGTVSLAYSAVGDGGSDTSTNAKGAYFGANPSVHLDTGATNAYFAGAFEADITISTGASTRYAACMLGVGFNAVRGTEVDAGLAIGAGTGHVGFKHGLIFTDFTRGTTENPFYSASTIIGTYWQAGGGGVPTVTAGVDFGDGSTTGFLFTGNAFASKGFSVSGAGAISSASSIKSTSPTAGVGYATGAGGTVTQGAGSGKATGVTLDKASGAITMNNAALASSTTVSFVLTNAAIAATDVIVTSIISGASTSSYLIYVRAAAGSATFDVFNRSGGSLSEAIVIQFVVIKGVNA